MARIIKLKRVSDNKGKDAYDIDRKKKRIEPGEGGALDPNDPLLKDEQGYYTLNKSKGLPAQRGNKYNVKGRGKSAR